MVGEKHFSHFFALLARFCGQPLCDFSWCPSRPSVKRYSPFHRVTAAATIVFHLFASIRGKTIPVFIFLRLTPAVLILFLAFSALAVEPETKPDKTKARPTVKASHKPSWFQSRPARASPAEQLAYADTLREAGKLRKAGKAYRALVYAWPSAAEAPSAQWGFAQTLDERKKLKKAFEEYQYLLETYPGFFSFKEVLHRQYVLALNIAMRRHWFLFIPYSSPEDAVPLFEAIIANAPYGPRTAELYDRLAWIHEETGEEKDAIEAYRALRAFFPSNPLADRALLGQVRCYYRLTRQRPQSGEILDQALRTISEYLATDPDEASVEQVRQYQRELLARKAGILYRQAYVYDKILKHPRSAMLAYDRFVKENPESELLGPAEKRLIRLKQALEPTQKTEETETEEDEH